MGKRRHEAGGTTQDRAADGGFTLLHLLIVVGTVATVAILALTVALLLFRRRPQNGHGKSAETLAVIAGALKGYRDDHGEYPPSNPRGAEALCRLLTGYPPDLGKDGIPQTDGAAFAQDDGREGFGFRLEPRGLVFGPYNGAETLRVDHQHIQYP